MCEQCSNITINRVRNSDPTQTTMLRKAFTNQMRKRFNELVRVITESIVNRDCFGLKNQGEVLIFQTYQMTPTAPGQFQFLTNPEKITHFMTWLKAQTNSGILEVQNIVQVGTGRNAVWTNQFIYNGYRKGVKRARTEMGRIGIEVPALSDAQLDSYLGTPVHIDRVGVLYTRTFNDLKGITDAMDTQISRMLSEGMIAGDSPSLIARKMKKVITGVGDLSLTDTLGRYIPARRRAEILARTEIIRAHHLGTIQEYRNYGVAGVKVKAEFRTAGDERVCEECEALEGTVYTLDEAEGVIPVHPQCRCIMLPFREGVDTALNTNSRMFVDGLLKRFEKLK